MTASQISRLWWTAMENFGKVERHSLPPTEEERAWLLVLCTAKRLLRIIRKSRGRFPKPPGLEEMQLVAASHFQMGK